MFCCRPENRLMFVVHHRRRRHGQRHRYRKSHFSNAFGTQNGGCHSQNPKESGKKTGRSVCLQWSEWSEIVVIFLLLLQTHVIKTDLANRWVCTQTKCLTLLSFQRNVII